MPGMLSTEIRKLRTDREMTQTEFAAACGLTGGMIGLVETDRRLLSVESIDEIVAGLGLSVADRDRLLAARKADMKTRGRKPPIGVRVEDIEAHLDRIEDRLRILEGVERGDIVEYDSNVTPLAPKQRSRKADPGYRVEIDQAAGGDSDQADTDHEDVGPHQRGPDVHPGDDFNQDPGGE